MNNENLEIELKSWLSTKSHVNTPLSRQIQKCFESFSNNCFASICPNFEHRKHAKKIYVSKNVFMLVSEQINCLHFIQI